MSRPLRIDFPGAVYHVMNRGGARQMVFLNRHDYESFLATLAEAHELWRIEVFAYCLMGNHYHLCLRAPEGNLSRVMRHVDGLYTQRFNRGHARDGALFRGRYKAVLVDADEYLTQVVRYIHLNPVSAGLVKEPQDYRWSSQRDYLRARGAPRWLKAADILQRFGGSRSKFEEFVLSGNEESLERFYAGGKQSPVLGGERFRERVMRRLGKIDREHPRYERVGVRPTADRVLRQVARSYGVDLKELLEGRRGRQSEARKVGMYLVKRLCDLTLQQTAGAFGVNSYGVVAWACHLVRGKIESDRVFRNQVRKIEKQFYQQNGLLPKHRRKHESQIPSPSAPVIRP